MADRMFLPSGGTLDVDVKTLYCQITVGATGAVTSFTGKGRGIKTVVRNSAGNYTLTLEDQYQNLKWGDVQLVDATSSDPTSVACVGRVASAAPKAATPTVVIQGYLAGTPGSAADFRNGAVVMVKLELQNSTVT
jgi:hypothetical protein